MEGLIVWSCLALLLQFHGVLCDDPLVNHENVNDERIKRYHESDCEKLRAKHELNKSQKTITPISQKTKIKPNSVIKQKVSMNERNEPNKVINHILEEIANNHNQTKGIHKIRHLVDEIDKENEITGHESKLGKPTPAKVDKIVKTLKKEEEKAMEKVVLTNQLENEIKSKELTSNNNLPLKQEKYLEIVSSKNDTCPPVSENTLDVKINEPKSTSRRKQLNEETLSSNDSLKKQDLKDNNLIEIEEHTYEEESLQTPCKYTQPNTYNWYTAQNYNPGFCTNNYDYSYGNNYNTNCYPLQSYQTTYPSTYGEYNNGNYYTHTPDIVNPVTSLRNDYIRRRKTWLNRDTIIDVKNPIEYQVKVMNEDKKDITSIHRPDFHRKYYSVTQKQYSSNVSKNQNLYYYMNPYHCS